MDSKVESGESDGASPDLPLRFVVLIDEILALLDKISLYATTVEDFKGAITVFRKDLVRLKRTGIQSGF